MTADEVLNFSKTISAYEAAKENAKRSQTGAPIEKPDSIDMDEQEYFSLVIQLGGVDVPKGTPNPWDYARLEIHKREAIARYPEKQGELEKAVTMDAVAFISAIAEKGKE